jgi:uncharacterized protein
VEPGAADGSSDEMGSKLTSGRRLRLLQETLAIARFNPDADIPPWVDPRGFSCIVRTSDSLTIVCGQSSLPENIPSDREWRCFEVQGPLDLSLTGILASLTDPLARAGVPVFALSSYETDFILVKEARLTEARRSLEAAGFVVDT